MICGKISVASKYDLIYLGHKDSNLEWLSSTQQYKPRTDSVLYAAVGIRPDPGLGTQMETGGDFLISGYSYPARVS